ncbi:MAG: hypothetical protein ACE5GJ_01120 [Gemmatimonadota bacterium]
MRRARRRRVIVGGFVVVLLALGLGLVLGIASHRTAQEVVEAQRAQRRKDFDISREVNRTLLELWKMEDVEAARSRIPRPR